MKFMLDFNILFWYIIQCQLRNWHKKILNQKKLKKVLTLNIWFDILNLLTWKREQEWSLKTEQNVNSLLARIWTNFWKNKIFFWRVWSWLRMNAGGMPKTCKSNEVAFWRLRTCTKLDRDSPPSGRRVSNT